MRSCSRSPTRAAAFRARCSTAFSTASIPIRSARAIAASASACRIVRAFVELHGGQVLIDSAPGEGTTVTCIFPAAEPVESAVDVSVDRLSH